MKSLTRTYVINAPVSRVWNALVDPEIIDVWGGGPAKMNAKKGSDFSLWGGDIHGTNTGVIEGELLEQDWYGGDWEKPSRVSFRLLAVSPDKTKVTLAQSEIPDTEFDDIADGWKRYYLGPLKALLEK